MLRRLTGRGAAVVAAGTGAGHRGVIHPHLCPIGGHMAEFTAEAGGDMLRGFTRCGGTVMTARAVPGHTRVIDVNLSPVTGHVTVLTSIGR